MHVKQLCFYFFCGLLDENSFSFQQCLLAVLRSNTVESIADLLTCVLLASSAVCP